MPPADSSATRASLLYRARQREHSAWHELVDLYGPLVAQWCVRCGLDPHATADCVQETFAAVVKSLPSYQPMKANGAFRSWLWTITSNKIKDYWRRKQREIDGAGGSTALQFMRHIPDSELVPDAEPSDQQQLSELFRRALAQVQAEFEPRTWEIFQRAVFDRIETAVVAQEFGVTSAAVRQARSRILRRLRQQLGDFGEC
jgi:RNA polymerase sigma-70 factor (ECF subfamily)